MRSIHLALIFGLLGPLPPAFAACDADGIGPAQPSTLGLWYATRFRDPLPAILSQGEAERLAALDPPFAARPAPQQRAIRREWRQIVKGLFAGTLPQTFTGTPDPTFDTLRAVAPRMLARLVECGPRCRWRCLRRACPSGYR